MAVRLGQGKGAPLGEHCRPGGFPCQLCRLAEYTGGSVERPRLHLGPRALRQEPCCEPPGYPGSRSPQDALSVPSMEKAGFEV